jgi:hypothetical protein
MRWPSGCETRSSRTEDIDLVQTRAEPIGATVDAIRDALSWLGKCNRAQARHSMHLVFKFAPESAAQTALKLKVEVNTREHANLHGFESYPFAVESDWYQHPPWLAFARRGRWPLAESGGEGAPIPQQRGRAGPSGHQTAVRFDAGAQVFSLPGNHARPATCRTSSSFTR